MGISYFEWWRLYLWHYQSNSCNNNWVLVFWSKWRCHISSFQFISRLEMTKTQICSVISDKCPISNSDTWFFPDSMSEITDFNGISNSKICRVRNYWLIKPVWTSLNQFLCMCQKWLINKNGVVTQNANFL